MLEATIRSRAFSSGFDIETPAETFSAKAVGLSPTGEIHILNASGSQVARLEQENFLSNIYNIIITGGGFYQFERDRKTSRAWTLRGEGRLLHISERKSRGVLLSENAQEIAECSKRGRSVKVFNDSDFKLALCAFLALSLLEDKSNFVPV